MTKLVPLTSLDPRWLSSGGEGISDSEGRPVPQRDRVALSFLCPCDVCVPKRKGNIDADFHLHHVVYILNPEDGGEPVGKPAWHRCGTMFDELVLQPSILSDKNRGGCGWHGFVGGQRGDQPGMVETL